MIDLQPASVSMNQCRGCETRIGLCPKCL